MKFRWCKKSEANNSAALLVGFFVISKPTPASAVNGQQFTLNISLKPSLENSSENLHKKNEFQVTKVVQMFAQLPSLSCKLWQNVINVTSQHARSTHNAASIYN